MSQPYLNCCLIQGKNLNQQNLGRAQIQNLKSNWKASGMTCLLSLLYFFYISQFPIPYVSPSISNLTFIVYKGLHLPSLPSYFHSPPLPTLCQPSLCLGLTGLDSQWEKMNPLFQTTSDFKSSSHRLACTSRISSIIILHEFLTRR